VCYSSALDSTDISTSGKGKTPASTSGVEAYSKEALSDKIRRLTTTNTQLVADKMETEKARVNLETDRARLLSEKNFLVAKREELRAEIATLNAANIPVRGYQDLLLGPIRDKLKAKRPPSFDGSKENFQKFLTGIRYYQRFYQQNLPLDSNKVQDAIINMMENVSKWGEPLLRDFLEYNSDNQKEFI